MSLPWAASTRVSVFQSGFQPNEQDPFYTGKIGMVIHGSWILDGLARYAPDLDFAVAGPVPAERLEGKGRFQGQSTYLTWMGGFSFAMPVGAFAPDEGWRFIRWMTSEECYLLQAAAQKRYNESKGRPFVFGLTANRQVSRTLLRAFPPLTRACGPRSGRSWTSCPPDATAPSHSSGRRSGTPTSARLSGPPPRADPQAALSERRALVQKELNGLARERLPSSYAGPVAAPAACVCAAVRAVVVGLRRRGASAARAWPLPSGAGWLMAGPWLFGFVLLTAGPILASMLFAFCDYDVSTRPAMSAWRIPDARQR